MKELGNIADDGVLDFVFNTHKQDGTPITLSGTPALEVYKGSSASPSEAGITLNVDHNSRVGKHHVRIDASADAFYVTGFDYDISIKTGTVDGTSVAGTSLGRFSIQNRYQNEALFEQIKGLDWNSATGTLKAIADRLAVILAAFSNINMSQIGGSTDALTRLMRILLAEVHGAVNDAAATDTSFVTNLTVAIDNFCVDSYLAFSSGVLAGQKRPIASYDSDTKVITVSEAFTAAPAHGSQFVIVGSKK